MRLEEIRTYFDKALALQEGEELEIYFPSEKAMDSARTAFYREKASFTAKVAGNLDIVITRRCNKELKMYKVILSLSPRVLKAGIRKADGSFVEIEHFAEIDNCTAESMFKTMPNVEKLAAENMFKTMKNVEKWSDEEIDDWCLENGNTEYSNGKWKELLK